MSNITEKLRNRQDDKQMRLKNKKMPAEEGHRVASCVQTILVEVTLHTAVRLEKSLMLLGIKHFFNSSEKMQPPDNILRVQHEESC